MYAFIIACTVAMQSAEAQTAPFLEVFEPAFPGLVFERPVALRYDPSGSEWLFVLEQNGRIKAFLPPGPFARPVTVLDISERVLGIEADVESGLIGFTLHPDYSTNGFIYVYYNTDITGAHTSRVSRFTIEGTPPIADPESEFVLIELPRTQLKHNGSDMHFSDEGYLYVSFGDALCCGDPGGNGQDLTNLFSTIIRIDVDHPGDGLPYTVPPDNPFVGNDQGWREEIWAYGLRNPWRFSIHPTTGEIWVGDVGELMYEEVNRVVAGGNYGWSVMEGTGCLQYPPGNMENQNCRRVGIPPAWHYGRDVGVSLTGGHFYRGSKVPSREGQYIFADWGLRTWFAATVDDEAREIVDVEVVYDGGPGDPFPSAFGEDRHGELYFLGYFDGGIYRFRQLRSSGDGARFSYSASDLSVSGPNPTRGFVDVAITTDRSAEARILVRDVLGRLAMNPITLEAPAGEQYGYRLDLSDLAAGVYLITLDLDGRPAQTRRVTLLP